MNLGAKLTPELTQQILSYIRAGAFVQEALRAAGVPDRAAAHWLNPSHTTGRLYNFQNAIKQAQAVARIVAAQEVKKTDPFKWLANGPARDAVGEPGWAAMSQAVEPNNLNNIDPMQFPEFLRFVNNVRLVMSMHPDARQMLDELMSSPTPRPLPDQTK